MLLIIIISDIITIRADIDSISFYSFNSESSNKRSTKRSSKFRRKYYIRIRRIVYGADRDKDEGCNEDWMELVFWKGGERVSRDFSRFLPSRGGREWVIYRPFRILDDSGNLRYEASSVEPEDRAICLAKKSAKTELDRRTVFIARSRTNFCSRSLFYTFPSFFFLGYRKIFQWFLPMLYFILPPFPGWNFSFRRVLKSFLHTIRKYSFFLFFWNWLIDSTKLLLFFSRNDIIRCNVRYRGN